MDRLLVTGGCGFIGSNFIRNRIRTHSASSIVNVDSLSYGSNPRNLAEVNANPRYQFVESDIRDSQRITELVADSDVLVHFAAESHVDRSISNPENFLGSNVVGTQRLLEAAKRGKVRKFIQISTDEVYGSARDDESFVEDSKLNPSSPYSASKGAADLFAISYYRTYRLPIIILRCTNNFGPYQFPEKFIPKTIIKAKSGGRIPIYGDGSQVRDWIYVADFCAAIDLVIDRGFPGSIYNVATGVGTTNLEVARKILRRLGKSTELIEFVEDRPGHDMRYSLNSEKIRNELGWKPTTEFDEALRFTIDWYLSNEKCWQPLVSDKVLSASPWKESW